MGKADTRMADTTSGNNVGPSGSHLDARTAQAVGWDSLVARKHSFPRSGCEADPAAWGGPLLPHCSMCPPLPDRMHLIDRGGPLSSQRSSCWNLQTSCHVFIHPSSHPVSLPCLSILSRQAWFQCSKDSPCPLGDGIQLRERERAGEQVL